MITIRKDAMEALVFRAIKCVGGANVADILKNFRLIGRDGSITVFATDLDLTLLAETTVAVIDEDFDWIVKAKTLLNLIRATPNTEIKMTEIEEAIRIEVPKTDDSAVHGHWNIPLVNTSDYPDIPEPPKEWETVMLTPFIDTLDKVLPAAATSGVQPALGGVSINDKRCRATDGVRLHQVKSHDLPDQDLFLSVGATRELIRLSKFATAERIKVGQSDKRVYFQLGYDLLAASRVYVDYPDLDPWLDDVRRLDLAARAEREDFVAAVNMAKEAADEDAPLVSLGVDKGQLRLTCEDKSGRDAEFFVDISGETGGAEILVNWEYLLNMLESMDEPIIEMAYSANESQPMALIQGQFVGVLRQWNRD